jgi:WD40 repeat protein
MAFDICPENAATVELLAVFEGHTGAVRQLMFSRHGTALVSRSAEEIIVWDLHDGTPAQIIKQTASRLALSPDGTLLALAQDGVVVLLDITPPDTPWARLRRGPRRIHTLTASDGLHGLAFTPNGRLLFTIDTGGIVRAWDTRTWTERYSIREWTVPIIGLAVSADGLLLALGCGGEVSGDYRCGIRLRDAELNRQIGSLGGGCPKGEDRDSSDLAFSPDGTHLAVNGEIWDVARRTLSYDVRARSVAFSRDSRLFAYADLPSSMSSGKTIRLAETRTGQDIAVLRGHTEQVWQVAFSPDGSVLASCSGDLHWWTRPLDQAPDKTIRLWGNV